MLTVSNVVLEHIGRAGEDRYCSLKLPNLELYAVFDGHGGSEVSEFLRATLPYRLLSKLQQIDLTDPCAVKRTIVSAFLETDGEIAELKCKSGSTAVVALILSDIIYLVNLGDSRGVIFNNRGEIYLRTSDHKPDRPDEKDRIYKAGGRVVNYDVPRIDSSGSYSLALSRAFGDMELKRPLALVSVHPEVYALPTREYIFGGLNIILASDGLWDTLSTEQVVRAHLNLPAVMNYACNKTTDDITVMFIKVV